MRWTRNRIVEQHLESLGVPFHYEESIKFSEIDLKKSAHNQARILGDPITDDHVLTLAMVMENDGDVPAPVLWQNGKGKLIADGNHRCKAFSLDAKRNATIDAYILDTDDEQVIQRVTRSLNRTNGIGQSTSEATEHIVQLLDKYPHLTQAQLCSEFGLKADKVAKAVRQKEVADTLFSKRIDPKPIAGSGLLELAKLRNHEPVMEYAGRLASEYKLTADRIRDLVAECKSRRSEATMLGALSTAEGRLQAEFPRRGKRDTHRKRHQFERLLANLIRFVAKHPTKEHLQLTAKSDFLSAQAEWEKVKTAIDRVFSE